MEHISSIPTPLPPKKKCQLFKHLGISLMKLYPPIKYVCFSLQHSTCICNSAWSASPLTLGRFQHPFLPSSAAVPLLFQEASSDYSRISSRVPIPFSSGSLDFTVSSFANLCLFSFSPQVFTLGQVPYLRHLSMPSGRTNFILLSSTYQYFSM